MSAITGFRPPMTRPCTVTSASPVIGMPATSAAMVEPTMAVV